ncbi:hypothetical protein HMN09_01191300 [Mycena chlorophos]|uniref:Protein kinase domain-containing protein n=1 Tax=Mycena chlorophos TaxID=658473 RepID=A0A8H6VWW4_MYCCL|nr:hypothetical protein HMN09_01191300 [Mycena chlorophos]
MANKPRYSGNTYVTPYEGPVLHPLQPSLQAADAQLDQYIIETYFPNGLPTPNDLYEGKLHFMKIDALSLPPTITTLHQFKAHAKQVTGANLRGTFALLGAPEVIVYFERVETNAQQRLLTAPFPPNATAPSKVAAGGAPLREAISSPASRVHGVYPVAFDTSDPLNPRRTTLETAHCASHAEPLAEMWIDLKKIHGLTEKELSKLIQEIHGASEIEVLNAAEAFLNAQNHDYGPGEPGFRAVIAPLFQKLLGLASDVQIAEYQSEPKGARTDIVTMVHDRLGLQTEIKLSFGAGDPSIQAVASVVRHARIHESGSEEPIISLTMGLRARSVIEIGHVFAARYQNPGEREESAWVAALDDTLSLSPVSTAGIQSDLDCLRLACSLGRVGQTLERIYTLCRDLEHLPPVAPSVFPHRMYQGVQLSGTLGIPRLLRKNDMNIFQTTWNDGTKDREVVVKMFPATTYGLESHLKAADDKLAPEIIFQGKLLEKYETGWSICVMEYISPTQKLSMAHIESLKCIPKRLKALGLIHGDLRLPNILFLAEGRVMIVDWNCASGPSLDSRSRYPRNINPAADWVEGVVAGAPIEAAHDYAQISRLVKMLEDKMVDGELDIAELEGQGIRGTGISRSVPSRKSKGGRGKRRVYGDDMDVDSEQP